MAHASLRLKLIGLVAGSVFLVLCLVAVVVDSSTNQAVFSSIDRELDRRTRDFSTRGPGPRRPLDRPFEDDPGTGRRRPNPRGNRPLSMPIFIPNPPPGPGETPRPEPLDPEGLRLARQGTTQFRTVVSQGEPMRIISRPLILENGLEGVIQASTPLSDFLASLAELRQTLLFFVLPLGVALASLVSLLVVGQLLAPIRRIVAEVEGIQVADENRRVAVVGKDEFAELATTLNNMLSRLSQGIAAEKQANQKLREAMERQKRFTADASHEMKTPLAIIKAHSGLIAEESAYKQESISAIDEAATRMIQLTAGLLDLAKIDAQRDATMVPIFASALLKDLALSFAHEGSRITFQNDPADPAFLGQFDEATRALQNLIQNALTHGGPGQVLVKVVIREARIQFAVSDQGKGIPAEHLPHLFERFYRVDSSRNSQSGGSGLGLAIVQAIAERHLGTVSVQSDSTGTTFTLDLPLWQSKDV